MKCLVLVGVAGADASIALQQASGNFRITVSHSSLLFFLIFLGVPRSLIKHKQPFRWCSYRLYLLTNQNVSAIEEAIFQRSTSGGEISYLGLA